ncbi:MAG: mannose-6-phosphate isomerase, class [Actinomycetota bacterium]|nr:mannose-6-phosphate isomerase, class [Actinomycetota bacterium]
MTNPVRTPVSDRQSAGDAGAVATSAALGPWPQMMENPIRDYEWGSTIALARLQGRPSSGRPEAELWMGAHPSGPSRLVPPGVTDPGQGRSLDDLVTRRPLDLLGGEVFDRFGPRLPFLLKILAISRPLSVQVHPTGDRARTAFEGEAGSEGTHCYVDPFPKPELLYALEPIDAMCGFRPAADALRLLDLIGGERTATVAEPLRGRGDEGDRIEAAFKKLVTWPVEDRAALVVEIREVTRELLAEAGPQRPGRSITPEDRRALTWASRLTAQHEADPLVAAPFLLDLVQLQPGETLFVPAGAPHAYLHGLGVEIMGNSDNVLRAGLTHKPIAVEELLRIVHGGSRPQRDIPESWVSPYEVIWSPGVPEFRLSRIWLHEPRAITAYPQIAGPQIILCTAGTARVSCGGHDVVLAPGRSAFVGATAGPITLAGPGEVFRAFTGDLTLV